MHNIKPPYQATMPQLKALKTCNPIVDYIYIYNSWCCLNSAARTNAKMSKLFPTRQTRVLFDFIVDQLVLSQLCRAHKRQDV